MVTGASRRIGASIVRHLHGGNMHLIVHFNRSSAEASDLVAELCDIRPASASLLEGDLRDMERMTFSLRETVNRLGRLDVLVNNASAFFPTPLGKTTDANWQDIMDTNLKAPYFLSQAAAPYLQKTAGSIVNIVDIYAERPLPSHPVYSASKAGLLSLTRSLAMELGPDVRVNSVSPGAILWPENDYDELSHQRMISRTPLKRTGAPEDIASAVQYLVDADYVTGQNINVDGGRSVYP